MDTTKPPDNRTPPEPGDRAQDIARLPSGRGGFPIAARPEPGPRLHKPGPPLPPVGIPDESAVGRAVLFGKIVHTRSDWSSLNAPAQFQCPPDTWHVITGTFNAGYLWAREPDNKFGFNGPSMSGGIPVAHGTVFKSSPDGLMYICNEAAFMAGSAEGTYQSPFLSLGQFVVRAFDSREEAIAFADAIRFTVHTDGITSVVFSVGAGASATIIDETQTGLIEAGIFPASTNGGEVVVRLFENLATRNIILGAAHPGIYIPAQCRAYVQNPGAAPRSVGVMYRRRFMI